MRLEWKLTLGAGVFLAAVFIVYWIWSGEPTGSVCLLFGALAWLLIFAYILGQSVKMKGRIRPEDDAEATMTDGEGPVDFFPAASMWPLGIGLGLVIVTLGMMFGYWYTVIGVAMVIGGIMGFATEAQAPRPAGSEVIDHAPIVDHQPEH